MTSSADDHERSIVSSWHANAEPWIDAVRLGTIASREVTDRAIIEAVRSAAPRSVLDVGCGEGWLARALQTLGIQVVGIDGVPSLIAAAERAGGGEFLNLDYGEVIARRLDSGPFDAVVFNFSLFGEATVESLIGACGSYLRRGGSLIIQTLHPVSACGNLPYADGWRPGSWEGIDGDFNDPAPWYFRTLYSWSQLLRRCGFTQIEIREPTFFDAPRPVSVIFICRQDIA